MTRKRTYHAALGVVGLLITKRAGQNYSIACAGHTTSRKWPCCCSHYARASYIFSFYQLYALPMRRLFYYRKRKVNDAYRHRHVDIECRADTLSEHVRWSITMMPFTHATADALQIFASAGRVQKRLGLRRAACNNTRRSMSSYRAISATRQ